MRKLSDDHTALARDVGFSESAVQAIRDAGDRLRQLQTRGDDGQPQPAAGLTIDVPERKVSRVTASLRRQLGSGYFVFRSEQQFGMAPDEVSVLKTGDQFEVLRVMRTNGWNYDLSPDAVIAQLEKWDAQYGLALRGAGFGWAEAAMERPPSDMLAFARAVHEFCPDLVDQGTQTVEVLADEMRRTGTLYLWWD
jgi:Domain of unknown function (DUF4253)